MVAKKLALPEGHQRDTRREPTPSVLEKVRLDFHAQARDVYAAGGAGNVPNKQYQIQVGKYLALFVSVYEGGWAGFAAVFCSGVLWEGWFVF